MQYQAIPRNTMLYRATEYRLETMQLITKLFNIMQWHAIHACDRRDQRWFKSLRRPPALNWGDSENYCELSLTQATVGSLDQGDLE